MKLNVIWRKVSDYVGYDLKEIAFPSSLPDPPHIKKRRKLTMKERYLVLKEASRLYAAELRPNEYKKKRETEGEWDGENGNRKEKEPSTLEDLGCKGRMDTLRPAHQQGYQEGIQQTMEKTKDSKFSKDTDASNSKGPT
ncbi:unnamed protein product [Withania somnifera]